MILNLNPIKKKLYFERYEYFWILKLFCRLCQYLVLIINMKQFQDGLYMQPKSMVSNLMIDFNSNNYYKFKHYNKNIILWMILILKIYYIKILIRKKHILFRFYKINIIEWWSIWYSTSCIRVSYMKIRPQDYEIHCRRIPYIQNISM